MEATDKETWGNGPWCNEPDRVEFKHAGLPCIMRRVPGRGHWCGYAAVPPGHPFHGRHNEYVPVDVHGGLTYAEGCADDVCHVPDPGEPDDVWWFGFDCAHGGDLSPSANALSSFYFRSSRDVYRDITYVRSETERLAEQLAALKQPPPSPSKRSR